MCVIFYCFLITVVIVSQGKMLMTFCECSGPRRGLRGARRPQQWSGPSVSKCHNTLLLLFPVRHDITRNDKKCAWSENIEVLISCRALEVLNLFFNYIFNLRLEVWTLILFFSTFLFSIFKWFSNWLRMLKIYVPFILKRIKLSSLIISIILQAIRKNSTPRNILNQYSF